MKDAWRITNGLTNSNPNIPTLTINGKPATTIQEKLNTFANTFEQLFSTNSDVDHTFTVSAEQVVNGFLTQPLIEKVRSANYSEIAGMVSHRNPRKAAGPDGIKNIILQHLPRLVPKTIVKIVNRSLALHDFLTQWKGTKIAMLKNKVLLTSPY
jgi:hypothetical protein